MAGADAEADARRKGRSAAGLGVLDYVDALAENRSELDEADIALNLFYVYGLAGQSLWSRARIAMRVLRDGRGRARRRPRK